MLSPPALRKTIIVFRKPPIIKEATYSKANEKLDIKDNTYKELSLNWEGFHYLLKEDEKQHDYNGSLNTKTREETEKLDVNSSFLETSDSSDGVVLHYSFNQNDHLLSSSSNLSENCNQFITGLHKNKSDCNVIKSDFSSDKFLETSETASIQSEFDAVMKTLDVKSSPEVQEENNNRNDNKTYDCNSYNGRTSQESPIICKNISLPNRCLVGTLMVEPLCGTRTGKFNILAYVLQVDVERVVRLRNGNYAEIAVLYVADTKSDYVKLTLWHDSKNWIRHINVGCIIVVTDVIQHSWKSQLSLATTFSSHMFDVCHAKSNAVECWPEVISREVLNDFILHMKNKYPSISKSIGHFPSVKKAENIEEFDNLVPGAIVNVVAIVLSIFIGDRKDQDGFQHPIARAWLKDKTGRKIRLSVWQNESSILPMLRKNHGKWVNFARLAVRTLSTGDGLELHSKSDTVLTVHRVSLQPDEYCSLEKRKCESLQKQIKGSIGSLEFLDKRGNTFTLSQNILDEVSSSCSSVFENKPSDIFAFFGDIMYTACSNCLSELEILSNGECKECKRCIKMSWKYDFKKIEMLWPFKLLITRGELDPLSVAVFPDDFDRMKSKVPLKYILQIYRSAKEIPRKAPDLKENISRLFQPREYLFYVSRYETDGSNTPTREEVYLLKDVEEQY